MQRPQSDFNLRTISTKEYAKIVEATIQYGGNCFVVGRRGCGKTEILNQVIEKSGCKLFFWNVSTLERVDAAGFPDISSLSRKDEYVRYILPLIFKPLLEGDEPIVAVLDEVDKADKELHAPLLEFLRSHSINGRKFKNLRSVLMTGNLPAEGGKRPILPLLDRTEKYLLEPTIRDFLEWGSTVGDLHASVLAYLTDVPADIYGDINPGESYGTPSPRMWEEVSKIAKYGEAHNWAPELITTKAAGCLGKVVGIRYQAYFDHYQVLMPDIADILNGKIGKQPFPKGTQPSKKITMVILLCTRVANLLDEMDANGQKIIPDQVRNAGKFLLKIDEELALIGVRNGIGKDRMFKHLFAVKEYDQLIEKLASQMKGMSFQ
jgi:hypothetical protein